MDAAVGDAQRLVASAVLETVGKQVREPDQADEAALADHRVVASRSAVELLRTRGASVGRLFFGTGERQQLVRPQSGGLGDQRRKAVAGVLGGCHHADLFRPVGPTARAARLRRADHGEAFAFGEAPGDVDQHRLQRLAVHVERLLAEIVDARAEVLDGGVCVEVAEFAAFGGDAARDLEQAVAVVGDRPHRRRSRGVAAQGAVLDEPGDHAGGLSLGRLGGSEPGHRSRGSGVAVTAQPARDGGMVDVDAAIPEPAPKLGGRAALVGEREEFMGEAVESGARVPGAATRAGVGLEARRFGGRVEGVGGPRADRVSGHAWRSVGGCRREGKRRSSCMGWMRPETERSGNNSMFIN